MLNKASLNKRGSITFNEPEVSNPLPI